MKTHPLSCLRRWSALLLLLLLTLPGQAQQQGQAAYEPLELSQGYRTTVVYPGRRITVVGPPNTQAIRGRLVAANDSTITVRTGSNHVFVQRQVAVKDVRGIVVRRLGWQIAAIYFAAQFLVILGYALAIVLTTTATGGLLTLGISTFIIQLIYWGSFFLICYLLGFRRLRMPPWKVIRRGTGTGW